MDGPTLYSRQYLMAFAAVAVVAVGLAVVVQDTDLALSAAILGIYVLHLLSLRLIVKRQQEQWQTLRELEDLVGELTRAEERGPERGLAALGGGGGTSVTSAGAPPAGEGRAAGGDGGRAKGPALAGTGAADRSESDAEEVAPGGGDGNGAGAGSAQEGEGATTFMDERELPVPRHFALGTVAIIREVLTPDEVAQILVEQRRRPKRRFGELAVELGFLEEAELEALLLAQQEGVYKKAEIQAARKRLEAYKERKQSILDEGP